MSTLPPWGGGRIEGRNFQGRNPMGWIVVGYNESIPDPRKQKEETIKERLIIVPRIHSKEFQEILWYCAVI